ncbi:MAG: 5-deoxy-glucuronate isomerase [Deltaproteobacteria bacterium]|nr:5-deoxy-glucuronate isomerase [Deltaproteobacteria bacterium]
MHPHLLRAAGGFPHGHSVVTRAGEPVADTGIDFGVLRLSRGEEYLDDPSRETALLLLDGSVELAVDGAVFRAERSSLFDQDPSAVHHAAGTMCCVRALSACELVVVSTRSSGLFPPAFFDASSMVETEHRDRDLLDGTSHRIVRTVFDGRNRPDAGLVLGEVVTLPGRWSSYPPHHHPQPEIYHYRFDHPSGFGFCQLGEDVVTVRQGDTVKILDMNDHAQVAAPGYAMFYVWVIRHLPGQPYRTPEFSPEHAWLKDPAVRVWRPCGNEDGARR